MYIVQPRKWTVNNVAVVHLTLLCIASVLKGTARWHKLIPINISNNVRKILDKKSRSKNCLCCMDKYRGKIQMYYDRVMEYSILYCSPMSHTHSTHSILDTHFYAHYCLAWEKGHVTQCIPTPVPRAFGNQCGWTK